MSDLDTRPTEHAVPAEPMGAAGGPRRELLTARKVPLGGVRGTEVERTLPQRDVPTVGAWCFVDRYGPSTAPMRVLPHPHTGLQTVTWPLSGPIRHRDSTGSDVVVRPGELDLMTAGHGVSHSEIADDGAELSGVQLWIALPDEVRHQAPRFEQHRRLPVLEGPSSASTVMVGRLGDAESPALVHTRALAADVALRPGTTELPLDPRDEHALLLLTGDPSDLDVDGAPLLPDGARPGLLHLGTGRTELALEARGDLRVLLLGGEPFREDLLMWWNLVARTHEEVVAAREEWEERSARFGVVAGHGDARIPAPPLPGVRLVPRRRQRD
ncbi:pirin family protein [uncultured Pseudokineococcus sp.]|uniref:pirin family protein n=1 Tax=uncultured Pseudokineococcus sp. TaxID=1642928 RepID=UPI00262243AA|nr:pirin family protein [uncultured Pseudokineococcus sp.]